MSVYSRWVEARGTTTIESTPAAFQPSYPVFSSRFGSGACMGEETPCELNRPGLAKYGATVKPYSDCTPSPGTTGFSAPCAVNSGELPIAVDVDSLSSATTASTRSSTPCTYETARAPSEWPTSASRVVRPGVTDAGSGERSNWSQSGLKPFTWALPAPGLPYGAEGVDRKKSI